MKKLLITMLLALIPTIGHTESILEAQYENNPSYGLTKITITSFVDKVTINSIVVNRGNSRINCNEHEDKKFVGSPLVKKRNNYDLPDVLGYGDTWKCSGPLTRVLEIIVDTKEYGQQRLVFQN